MRVGLIAPPWLPVPPPLYGGTETFVDQLAQGLGRAGHEVLLVTTGDSTCPVPRSWVEEAALTEEMGRTLPEMRHVFHAYRAVGECEVVHDHTVVGPLLAHTLAGVPVVATNHGPFNGELGELFRAVCDRVGVIAISHHQASLAEGVRITAVIHHGVAPDRFPMGSGDGGYFAFLGRITPEKGAARAARAARELGARLVIAGKVREPQEREYFRTQLEPLLDDAVTFAGEIGGQDKLDLLSGAQALLNPIRWPEPFGLVMIESLACGTPVVSFREGAAPEIVEDTVTGFLCDDEAGMVDAMRAVDELSRRVCRKSVEDYFSIDRVVRDHIDLYQRLDR